MTKPVDDSMAVMVVDSTDGRKISNLGNIALNA